MAEANIINICYTRYMCELNCKDCIYYGKPCERLKHRYHVNKPYEIEDIKLKRKEDK